jgi:hypothetical protein
VRLYSKAACIAGSAPPAIDSRSSGRCSIRVRESVTDAAEDVRVGDEDVREGELGRVLGVQADLL